MWIRKLLLVITILGVLFGTESWRLIRHPPLYQEDFKLYLSAANGVQVGANPYDPADLPRVVPNRETRNLNWYYPPYLLVFFSALRTFGEERAAVIWYFSKLLALVSIYLLWWKWYGRRSGLFFFLTAGAFAYRCAWRVDLESGNISTWEQFFLWFGFLAYFDRLPFFSGLSLFLSSQWKLTLSVFLPALISFSEVSKREKYQTTLAFSTAALLSLASTLFLYPSLLSFYLGNLVLAAKSESRDLSWDGTHFSSLYNWNYLFQNPLLGKMFWILTLLVVCVGFISIHKKIKHLHPQLLCAFLAASYAICVPRLKLYSLLILIPALFECKIQCDGEFRSLWKKSLPWGILLIVSVGGTAMESHNLIHRIYNLRFLAASFTLWGALYFRIARKTVG